MLPTRQETHIPHGIVGKSFLHIGESSHGFSVGDQLPIGAPRIPQNRNAMAERRGNLPCRMEGRELFMQHSRPVKREHRRLSAGHHNGVESIYIDGTNRGRPGCQSGQRGRRNKPHRDQVPRRVPARVSRVAHPVSLAAPPVRTENLHLVSRFPEAEIGMRQLAPPEPHRPTRRRRHSRIRDHDRHPLRPPRPHRIHVPHAHSPPRSSNWNPIPRP